MTQNFASVLFLVTCLAVTNCLGRIEYTKQSAERGSENIASGSCLTDDDCPLWMTCPSSKFCTCSKFSNSLYQLIKCDENGLAVLECFCMTYDNTTDQIQIGPCIENCKGTGKSSYETHHSVYNPVFNVTSKTINEVMCKNRFNRAGQLCGKCISSHKPQAYSFNFTCVECREGNRNLWKYILVALFPLTFFYFFILVFKVNTTSSQLHGYVFFTQAISIPSLIHVLFVYSESKPKLQLFLQILLSLFGFWNLEFFRTFNLGICLDMSPLSVRALDYTIAVYPLFLTVLSYILIELHDRNYKVLVILWKPFQKFFFLFRRNWNIRTSVIDAYTTLYLLSFYKMISVSFDLLVPVPLFSVRDSARETNVSLVLFYDGTVSYFGKEHLPYAILALFVTLVFVIVPILSLLIFRLRCFQKLMSCCNLHSHILNTLMDAFQGCYKDGTEPGTRDCRWFAALDLLIRVIIYSAVSFLYFQIVVLVLIFVVIVFVNVQPYKVRNSYNNKIDVTFYSLLALLYASLQFAYIESIKATTLTDASFTFAGLVAITPLVYISCLSIHWMLSRTRWGKNTYNSTASEEERL